MTPETLNAFVVVGKEDLQERLAQWLSESEGTTDSGAGKTTDPADSKKRSR